MLGKQSEPVSSPLGGKPAFAQVSVIKSDPTLPNAKSSQTETVENIDQDGQKDKPDIRFSRHPFTRIPKVKPRSSPSWSERWFRREAVSFDAIKNPAAQWVAEMANADGVDPKTICSAGLVKSMGQAVQNFKLGLVSKAIDENGKPLVVYHGADEKRTTAAEATGMSITTPFVVNRDAECHKGVTNLYPTFLIVTTLLLPSLRASR